MPRTSLNSESPRMIQKSLSTKGQECARWSVLLDKGTVIFSCVINLAFFSYKMDIMIFASEVAVGIG